MLLLAACTAHAARRCCLLCVLSAFSYYYYLYSAFSCFIIPTVALLGAARVPILLLHFQKFEEVFTMCVVGLAFCICVYM